MATKHFSISQNPLRGGWESIGLIEYACSLGTDVAVIRTNALAIKLNCVEDSPPPNSRATSSKSSDLWYEILMPVHGN